MTQDDGNGRKSPDSKSSGQNMLLYVAVAAVGISLVVMLFVKNSATVLSYQNLLQLIDASKTKAAEGGAIEIEQRQGDKKQRLKLSNLKDIQIGDRMVRGSIDLENLGEKPSKTNPRRNVPFQVFRSGADTVESELIARAAGEFPGLGQRPGAESVARLHARCCCSPAC